ncbi:nuclear body protein SP140-like protein isoform X2 [Gadus chalcogrammus]|uniref:nuclear body protein SP140-like protein isoform X2 n=1 Tax=Gadus chalcogrammus TaxID=1042646 RepID=UPI0024C36F43|nr:nuclear body protein SP140-like protein isoform X2 [Gadus chalcogrammus]
MNPLDFFDENQLQVFFRCNKTEMSCMDKPQTFLNQLRDHKLILEEKYKMIRIKSIDKMKTSVYELLDWIETERPRKIRFFWTCVFKEIITTQYPTLKRLRDSLLDGSFQFFDGEDSDKHTREGLSEEEYPEKERGGRGKRGSFCDRDDRQGQSSSQATPRKRRNLMKPTFGSFLFSDDEDSGKHAREGLSEDEFLENDRGGRGKRGSHRDDRQGHSSSQATPRKRKKLMKPTFGSFPLSDEESSGEHAREGLSEDKSMGKERGGRDKLGSFCDRDEQQGHSSSQASPRKRKPTFGSLPKGENVEIWTWALYKHHLPVTCGEEEGTLYRDKLAKGEPCILRSKKWYTPCAFEKLSGKLSCRNWKTSIRCKDTTLEKLLKDGHLTCPGYNKSKAKKSTLPCSSNTVSAISESEEEMEEEEGEEEELQANPYEEEVSMEDEVELQGNDSSTQCSDTDQGDNLDEVTDERPRVGQNEFRVICGALSGMLHRSRFASGRCGKSIRTEDRWMSPVEFVAQGSAMLNAPWRRDIQWKGQPLSSLLERKMLHLHSEQCDCPLCHPDPKVLEEQKNDDYCFVCGRLGDLVMCDHCPRSFHQKCHLPQLDPSILGDDSKWMCTFCIWNMNEYFFRMTYEETLMHPVSNHMLPCHYLLLSLYNADKDQIFAKDPCIHVRGYSSQIVTPMWLDKITELLGQQYTVGQLLTDIQLIFSNCDKFNQNRPEFRDMGIKLKEFYEQVVEKVFRRQ